MTASVDRPGPCDECGAPRQSGQRYCLSCGARAGSRDLQLQRLLGRVRERCEAERPGPDPDGGRGVTGTAPAADAAAPGASTGNGGIGAGLRLPSTGVSAVLVAMFLAFGVLIGGVAASPVQSTLSAAAARHVKLVLPPAQPSASTPTSTPIPGSTSSETPSAAAESPAAGESEGGLPAPSHSRTGSGSTKPSLSAGSPGSVDRGGGGEGKSSAPAPDGSSSKLPPVKHVFVIALSDQPYASVFGPSSSSPYLARTLEHRGELLVRYYAVAHQQLANEIALISGQGPTIETAANCPTYSDIVPATAGAQEQVTGAGCVYPSSTQTLPGQLNAKHLSWRAYIEGMDEGAGVAAGGADGACGHPALGAADPSAAASPPAGQTYATWRNPFVYFHSLIDSPTCAADDVGLNRLAADLARPESTPNFSYIVPGLCHDGNPTPCAPGALAGVGAAESFLERVVGQITSSKAYKENGLLVITVDEAPSVGEFADSSSCCGQPQFPNLPPSSSGLGPEGGGQVGALLLSPFIKQGVSQEPYNHFSLLRTIEDFFGLAHLGYAGLSKVSSFEPSIFTRAK